MLYTPFLLVSTLIAAFTAPTPVAEQSPPTVVTIDNTTSEAPKTAKLVHVKTNFTVVEFIGEDTIIHDAVLAKEMLERGVLIPPALQGLYHGKEAIRLGEEEFQRAFKEIFCVNIFSSSNYVWQE
ncbi:MAG: hypothetical protein K2P51_08750 [Rhabdochlamydiaceae bacterium]|nr:hypothetical protein [Rhabdochlamydiaceae bacterium]